MDTTQIRQLVAAKIAGQGTNVDAGSALPDIINGLCDIIDNLPAPLPVVEITEDLSGGDYVNITDDRADEISNASILRYNNSLYTLASSTNVIGFESIEANPEPKWFSVWFNYLQFDDGNEAASYDAIVLYQDIRDNFYILKQEL